jgi:hypothetical protein
MASIGAALGARPRAAPRDPTTEEGLEEVAKRKVGHPLERVGASLTVGRRVAVPVVERPTLVV